MDQMTLRSAAFSDHTLIPERYSHASGDVSPPLQWSGVPAEAAELVLVCDDPDAPGGTFVHWLAAGIPPRDAAVAAGALPDGAVSGRNGFGGTGYGGPHPPVGDDPHRYFFRLYALREPSGLRAGFSADRLAGLLSKAIATGTVVGTFGR